MGAKSISPGGLERGNRALLTRLHRAFAGPFGVAEASTVLELERVKCRRLLAYLAERGWLTRVRHGLYTTVPLEAADPSSWLADPWAVAAKSFAPCYIGGWTALNHWELTEQLFRTVVVFTATALRRKEQEIQGTTFRLRRIAEDRLFGTKTVWRGKSPVKVSDPERTLVDVLDKPDTGGGIRHVADCIEEWLRSDRSEVSKLLAYAEQLGNGTVFKRLGYLLEARGVEESKLVEACAERMSTGLSALDPSSASKGKIMRRWRLRVNARV